MKPSFRGIALLALMSLPGCSLPQPTTEQVAGKLAPPDLKRGANLPGGPSALPLGAGAGGSAAAGRDIGRIGGPDARPTVSQNPPSWMAPVGASGSGSGDSGHPIPPNVSLAAPPDRVPAKGRKIPL